jgi:cysteine synthase A
MLPLSACDSILDLIGKTAVLQLARVAEPRMANVFVKLEHCNPTGSHKDRVAKAIVERAESDGQLKPGGTVIEASCGNMAVSLALACRVRGYSLIAVLPRTATHEHRSLLHAYGALMEFTDPGLGIRGAVIRAQQMAAEIPGSFFAAQHQNPGNFAAHLDGTGSELLHAIRANGYAPSAFVTAVGTGGALAGVGGALKRAFPALQRVAVRLERGSDAVSPIGETTGFVGLGTWTGEFDRLVEVSARDAWRTKDRLAREEGLLAGLSTGANVFAALALARELGPGRNVYTLCCDTGERYFSIQERL